MKGQAEGSADRVFRTSTAARPSRAQDGRLFVCYDPGPILRKEVGRQVRCMHDGRTDVGTRGSIYPSPAARTRGLCVLSQLSGVLREEVGGEGEEDEAVLY